MNSTTARRAGLVAVGLVTGLLASTAPASAASPAGTASVGFVDFTKAGRQVSLPTQAPCAVDGATSGSAPAVNDQPGLRFGGGTSSCTTKAVDGDRTETTSEATGQSFELSALMSQGGPRLKIGSWKAVCVGKETGTDAGWQLGGISGFSGLPSQIPSNYVHQVKSSKGVVLANVTFSEVVLPEPNDGGIGINAVHFRFTPESDVTGEIVLGAAACSPTP
ncbi:hypothetical protein [Umezawaea tangerina]|uniref:Secreted protein n=1 Tax=Umezawaea tangerina TaxID=84725 RepID=A0A2T0SP86_9PSEU|nr:hypothetical protein [Umezawaea tangerina]PRY35231.1 hypothetical protein CLV43_114149 [Umezawaea tangerina]